MSGNILNRINCIVAAFVVCSVVLPASALVAQSSPHRVRLAPLASSTAPADSAWYPQPLVSHTGTVVQFDADQISIVLAGQSVPTRFAASRVIEIESVRPAPDQRAALALFEQAEFGAALPALIRAISEHDAATRPPVWRQQWLSMLACQAAWRSGRAEIALELVDQLDARPLPPLMLSMLPIDWTGSVAMSDQEFEIAAGRAGSKSLAVKLVAASWLLRSPKYHDAAQSALTRLAAQSQRQTIAKLAGQLVWRSKTPPEIVADWQRWEQQINALPMALQTGPMVALFYSTRQAGLSDVAKRWQMTLEHAAPTWHPDRGQVPHSQPAG
ncbi:hypothetical protein NHH03_27445 [Stieleria sp. TO1_6]|uniref:hypothetical protein n=1 Tax=Stieleria tagensis TaxID=2956795 RepID=UPI00209ACDD0|nr:hypothetical protein [Stieleria tagensis]MCO8125504.1 hypothetical protein [Stieleria tagensis]